MAKRSKRADGRSEEVARLKHSEERAKKAHARLVDAIESIPEGFALFDAEDRLVLCNRQYRDMYPGNADFLVPGVAFEEIARNNAESGLIPESKGRIQEWISERLARHRDPNGATVEIHARDGWFRIDERQTREGGSVTIITDVTDFRRAERALVERNATVELLRTIATAANEAESPNQAIQTCLDAVCAHIGWPVGHAFVMADDGSGELVSAGLWHLDEPDRFETFRTVSSGIRFAEGVGLPGRVLATGEPAWIVDVSQDTNFPRAELARNLGVKTGFAFPVMVGRSVAAILEFFNTEAIEPSPTLLETMRPIGTQLGRVIERERASAALADSERRFRAVIDNSPSALLLKNSEGKFAIMNRRFQEWFGVGEEMIGKMSHDLYPKEYAENLLAQDAHVQKTGEALEFEYDATFADGSEHRILVTKFPVIDRTGKAIGIGAIGTDVSEQRRTEDQLRHAQKMEAIGQLTGGVAHDFNNLLTIIHGNLELIEEETRTVAGVGEFLAPAMRATRRATDLTQRLLAFSRRQVLRPRATDLGELAAAMTELMRRALGETIEVAVSAADDLWQCEVDPSQMESALLNLAINARDAMPDGGLLTIEAANIRLDDDYAAKQADVNPGQYVLLAVSDTGTGMPPDVADRAFEPFFTTKDVGKGTGLGLSMVYGFVKQSGGHVRIYSEEGEGTTVKMYLPRMTQPATAVSETEARSEAPEARGETVMIVEDDPDVRTLAVMLLRSLKYQILEARTGPDALALLDNAPHIDLLLTDVVLPGGMNGREFATEAQRRRPGLRVLYMSGYARDAIVHHGRLDADAPMLQKPFRKHELAEKVREVLSAPAPRSPGP